MKNKALSIIKKLNLELIRWKSGRSDMGVQYYEIIIAHNGKHHSFYDSYFPGEIYQGRLVDGKIIGGEFQRDIMHRTIIEFIEGIPGKYSALPL